MAEETIQFTQSGGQSDIEPGSYLVILSAISAQRSFVPQSGPNAGVEVTGRDWTFATDEWEITDFAKSSPSTRSKQYEWVSALLGAPAPLDKPFSFSDLIGREAMASVVMTERGWPKVASLVAVPKKRAAAPAAAPAARPSTRPAVVPAAAADDADLPF